MRWTQALARRGISTQSQILVGLVAVALGIIAAVAVFPDDVPFASLMVPLLLGSILLGPKRLPAFVLLILVLLAVAITQQVEMTPRTWGSVGIQVLMCVIVLAASWRRSSLGVAGAAGESMFIDLRDR